LDSVETPTEKRDNVLGGSAVFFSYAASFLTSVRLAGERKSDSHQKAVNMAKAISPISSRLGGYHLLSLVLSLYRFCFGIVTADCASTSDASTKT